MESLSDSSGHHSLGEGWASAAFPLPALDVFMRPLTAAEESPGGAGSGYLQGKSTSSLLFTNLGTEGQFLLNILSGLYTVLFPPAEDSQVHDHITDRDLERGDKEPQPEGPGPHPQHPTVLSSSLPAALSAPSTSKWGTVHPILYWLSYC